MHRQLIVRALASKRPRKRLKAIKKLKKYEAADPALAPETAAGSGLFSAHTCYSFSPFTPSMAAYLAYKSGLALCGIADHETLAGAQEFLKAAAILGIDASVGVQMRARFYNGEGRQLSVFYEKDAGLVTLHGIPKSEIAPLDKELAKVRNARLARGRRMVERFNRRLKDYGISLNFDKDVKPLSLASEGGTLTERHILYAFAQKLVDKFGDADRIKKFITSDLGINIEEEYLNAVSDIESPYYAHDLVSCLRNEARFFYVRADEIPDVKDVVAMAKRHGALIAYTYVGSAHRHYAEGEEKVITLEDGYLSEFIAYLGELGFDAVEYFPDDVPPQRAEYIAREAAANGMFVLPHCDVSSPRRRFAPAEKTQGPLTVNMWAVAGHERCAEINRDDGLNSQKSVAKNPDLGLRLGLYAEIAKLGVSKK